MSSDSGFDLSTMWALNWDISYGWAKQFIFWGDFNGDGKTDIGAYDGVQDWRFVIASNSGFDLSTMWSLNWDISSGWTKQFIFCGDFNGDGKTDIGAYDGAQDWRFVMSSDSGFDLSTMWSLNWDISYGWTKQFLLPNNSISSDLINAIEKQYSTIDKYSLLQNYPNPFNPTTTIKYDLPKNSFVILKVYDVLGRVIKTLVNSEETMGYHEVIFSAKDLPSGIYFYTLQADVPSRRSGQGFTQTKKMLLIK